MPKGLTTHVASPKDSFTADRWFQSLKEKIDLFDHQPPIFGITKLSELLQIHRSRHPNAAKMLELKRLSSSRGETPHHWNPVAVFPRDIGDRTAFYKRSFSSLFTSEKKKHSIFRWWFNRCAIASSTSFQSSGSHLARHGHGTTVHVPNRGDDGPWLRRRHMHVAKHVVPSQQLPAATTDCQSTFFWHGTMIAIVLNAPWIVYCNMCIYLLCTLNKLHISILYIWKWDDIGWIATSELHDDCLSLDSMVARLSVELGMVFDQVSLKHSRAVFDLSASHSKWALERKKSLQTHPASSFRTISGQWQC